MVNLDDIHPQMRAKLAAITLVVSDVDGVLTDGRMYLLSSGEEARAFNVKDGLGTRLLKDAGVSVAWLSAARDTSLVRTRASHLGVDLVDVGDGDKGERFATICEALTTTAARTLYIGDDVNDLAPMTLAGVAVCPADAMTHVKNAAALTLTQKGGEGAFREIAELILAARCA